MLNPVLHQTILISLIKSIYADPDLRSVLGFKGGTAAMLFHDLPRLSVDLDFDLLDTSKKGIVLQTGKKIFKEFGRIDQAIEKHYTLFFLIKYKEGNQGLKIEISKRSGTAVFEVKQYLGFSVLVMRREDMIAGKLAALLTRTHFAPRDMFDLWFFLKNHWTVDSDFFREKTGLSLPEGLKEAEKKVNSIAGNQLLQGLG